ncbi:MAG: hypothetical protein U1E61_17440 [Bradyrhizobium sp.]
MPKPKKMELNVVRLPPDLAVHVDVWAAAHEVNRAEALARLVEIGLRAEARIAAPPRGCRNDFAIEVETVNRIGLLIDPETPEEERERRIHRLTEGPPEFAAFRLDLPGRRPH